MFTYIVFVRIEESEITVTNWYESETVLMEIINIGYNTVYIHTLVIKLYIN
jgi:hypothetical protein